MDSSRSSRSRIVGVVSAVAMIAAACSSDDDAATTGADDVDVGDVVGDDDVPIEAPDGMTVTSDGFLVEEIEAGDDLATQLLIRLVGFADNIPADDRACMSVELAPLFPDGVPEDVQLDEEIIDALDQAAETCDVVM